MARTFPHWGSSRFFSSSVPITDSAPKTHMEDEERRACPLCPHILNCRSYLAVSVMRKGGGRRVGGSSFFFHCLPPFFFAPPFLPPFAGAPFVFPWASGATPAW